MKTSEIAQNIEFPLSEASDIVTPLMKPNPWIYWTDFIFHMVLGWTAFVFAILYPNFSPQQVVALLIAGFAIYRAAIFIHELAHSREGTLKGFGLFWNLTCGLPLFIPSFSYRGVHLSHHKRNLYGTSGDGEYLPFVNQGRAHVVIFLLSSFLMPFVFFIRIVLLTPIGFLSTRFRNWLWTHLSSLSIDLTYEREPIKSNEVLFFRFQEVTSCLYGWVFLSLFYTGMIPFKVAVIWYVVACTVFLMNSSRTLVAHRYRGEGKQQMSVVDQFLDSVDIPGNVLTALWAPVGLRYHATHHLFPGIPYHNLGKARLLLEHRLSEKTILQRTRNQSWLEAFLLLWKEAGAASNKS